MNREQLEAIKHQYPSHHPLRNLIDEILLLTDQVAGVKTENTELKKRLSLGEAVCEALGNATEIGFDTLQVPPDLLPKFNAWNQHKNKEG